MISDSEILQISDYKTGFRTLNTFSIHEYKNKVNHKK